MEAFLLIPVLAIGGLLMFLPQIVIGFVVLIVCFYIWIYVLGKQTDRAYEEAGSLAAWYSSGRKAPKVEIDYTQRKNLHKKNGGKPGFVTYHTNYSLMASPDISNLKKAD